MQHEVVIVGAGLAGLACARELQDRRISWQLLDASAQPGGRIQTEVTGEFRLDKGFQVLFSAYPAAQELLDYKALDLKPMTAGALAAKDGRLVAFNPLWPLPAITGGLVLMGDLVRLRTLDDKWSGASEADFADLPDISVYDFLLRNHFSQIAISRFFQPFFGGIFLDRTLNVSVKQFAFVWSMLRTGQTVIPANGIAAIPTQIADKLPRENQHYGVRVDRLENTEFGVRLTLNTGATMDCRAVVIATETSAAEKLLGMPETRPGRGSTCLYFECPSPVTEQPILILNTSESLVNHVVPVTAITPNAAPPGRHVVSATLLNVAANDDGDLAELVRADLKRWLPAPRIADWKLIRVDRIPFAQMAQPPGWKRSPTVINGWRNVYLAGEGVSNSSIQGALESGKRAALLVAQDLAQN